MAENTSTSSDSEIYLQLERAADGSKLYGVGNQVYTGVSIYNGRLTYAIRVSNGFFFNLFDINLLF